MKKAVVALFLVLSFTFLSLGYARLSHEVAVRGSVSAAAPPRGVFIIDVEVVAKSSVDDISTSYVSPTSLSTTVNAKNGGSITYRVTLENNSDATYWFRGLLYMGELSGLDNDKIGAQNGITIQPKDKQADSGKTFDTEDWIPPHTTRDIYVVYSFGSNATGTISTLVNFDFGGRVASYGDEILAILNDPEKYEKLSGAFDDAYKQDGSTIIANLGADTTLFDSLLGPNLTLDGQPVRILIERSNMDGKTTGDSYEGGGPKGCEYTIYVTNAVISGTPTVFAVSYTKSESGEWVQIGELYEGTTPIGNYTDGAGNTYQTVNVDKWEAAPATYTVFTYKGQSVTYKVNQKYGNSYQQQFTLDDLMSMKDQELFNQLNNHQIMKDAYTILFKEHVGSEATEILLLRAAYDDALRYYTMRNQGQEFSLSQSATRAELLSTVETLAKAMDYYMQVHDTSHGG